MKQSLALLLLFLGCMLPAQNSKSIDGKIAATADKNAEVLLRNTKANAVSIGIFKNGKVYTRHFGEIDKGKSNKASDSTLFEIGSVTKLFTGTLLAQAVLEGKIGLEDDIRKYLNGSYPNLEYKKVPVKIKDLVAFRSAFNKELPDNSELRKNENDSTVFYLKRRDEAYSKTQFLEELKTVKLDTFPGTVEKYSNTSLELTAVILENVYHTAFETLLREQLFAKLKIKHAERNSQTGKGIANGYAGKGNKMPAMFTQLWGAGGYRSATLQDLMQFMKFELSKEKSAVETQRNISDSDQNWNGYFWDGILVADNGKLCHKQGGTYGTQTFFAAFPERQLGIVIIVNQNTRETYGKLFNAVLEIAEDLKPESQTKKTSYGYRLTKDAVVFTYSHPKNLDWKLIKTVSVVGSFNDWNPADEKYKMTSKGNGSFEISIPKSQFERQKDYSFKFVINQVGWMTTPKNALNVDKTEDRNLIFRLD
ncbi:serine hydrolase [Flavobacterium sp.]|uniref:serine hydrolase n=1 Tax=Flavobacterium sp. TaxID=239 RepID=UPI00120A0015|nr:serine hydrolase [Flavobacterium sp.]RZJ69225.1 MAG: hypothetical protein EOO49_18175 [Flavobacterium sp.]